MRRSRDRGARRHSSSASAMLVATQSALAQNATSPILNQYANARGAWFDAIWPFANGLFALLATIEFAWSMAILALERADMQTFLAGFVRKIMWIGAFFTLLTFGPTWIPAIIDSFIDLGAAAGNGGAPLTPSLVFQRGIEIAGRLMDGAGAAMFITNFGASLALVASALLVMLAFVMVTIQFVVAMVESYIVVAAGLIFLGFGGSRWTVPYVERYIALAVAVGVKIMVLYLLIGLGMAVSEGWIDSAIAVPEQLSPGMSALEIVGSALIFGMLCWQAPKLVSGLLGGAPSLGAGDALSSAAGPAALAAGGAVLASAAAGSVIARVAAAASAGGASRGGSSPTPGGGGGGNGGGGGGGSGVGFRRNRRRRPPRWRIRRSRAAAAGLLGVPRRRIPRLPRAVLFPLQRRAPRARRLRRRRLRRDQRRRRPAPAAAAGRPPARTPPPRPVRSPLSPHRASPPGVAPRARAPIRSGCSIA